MIFPGEKRKRLETLKEELEKEGMPSEEEAKKEGTDIQPGNTNVKKSASFTAKQNDGTVKENIVPEQ